MGLQDIWGPLVAWYLFLAGAGAGAYLVGAIAERLGEKFRPLVKPGVLLGAPLVAIGSLLLLLDLGSPLHVWRAILRPYSSMMSLGILILVVFLVLGAIHMAALLLPRLKIGAKTVTRVGNINIFFALATAIYTGLLLGVVKAVPLWNTPALPLLFLVSAISTGIGAVLLFVGVQRLLMPKTVEGDASALEESLHAASRLDVGLVVVELLVLFFILIILAASQHTAVDSVNYLVTGGFAVAFWLGIVVIGLLLPIALEIWSITRAARLSAARLSNIGVLVGLCLLLGGIILRYAVISAGASVSHVL